MTEACVKSPDSLIISANGNPSNSWAKWKSKFEIYLQASGLDDKLPKQKVGLILHHIGEEGQDIFKNFTFLPERPNPNNVDENLPAEDKNDYATVMSKFDQFFTRRDPQLMIREKFWLNLKREPG